MVGLFTLLHRSSRAPGDATAGLSTERALALLLDGRRVGPRRRPPARPLSTAELGRR